MNTNSKFMEMSGRKEGSDFQVIAEVAGTSRGLGKTMKIKKSKTLTKQDKSKMNKSMKTKMDDKPDDDSDG